MINKKLKKLLLGSMLLCSATAMAENKQFGSLVDCWTAMDGKPYEGSSAKLKQDFHLVHVLRFTDKSRSDNETVLGKDNFLVFNRDGAQLLTPTSNRTPDPKYGDNGMNNYQMTLIPPGETNKMQVGYFTSLKGNDDTAGWYGAPGWTKVKDDLYAKFEKDPVKSMDFSKTRDVMRMVIKGKAEKEAAELEKTKERLNFWVKADYHSTGQGFGTHSLPNGQVNAQRLAYEKQRVEKAISLTSACSELGDETIKQAGLQKKATLQKLKDFLDGIGTQPAGQQQGDGNSARGAR